MFPTNPEIRKQWVDFVKTSRTGFWIGPGLHGRICSRHFENKFFANYVRVEMGFENKLRLTSDAIPTLAKKMPAADHTDASNSESPYATVDEMEVDLTESTSVSSLYQGRQSDLKSGGPRSFLAKLTWEKHKMAIFCQILDGLAPQSTRIDAPGPWPILVKTYLFTLVPHF